MKYIKQLREHFLTQPVFSIRDVKTYLSQSKISRQYVHTLLHHLLKRNELTRITKGFYTLKNDPNVLSFAFSPSYHCLQDALSIHNLWDQETNTVLVTPRKVRTGARQILGTNVIFRRIKRSMFFGFDFVKYYDLWIPVSDIEKTLIDFFYFNEPLDKRTIKEILKKIDKKKLKKYLKKVPSRVEKKINQLI